MTKERDTMFQSYFEMDTKNLFQHRNELKEKYDIAKKELALINEVLDAKHYNEARNELASQNKNFGTVIINTDSNHLQMKVNVKKKVSWDQAGLMTTLDTQMDADDARHYGKISVTIEERKYTNAPPAIKALLEPHRTVEMASTTYELEEIE
jgi:hypothetical protein|tara:strand:- start:38 stop:493 length:456 start_codon:yes stop_codon:yes gene_type:complete